MPVCIIESSGRREQSAGSCPSALDNMTAQCWELNIGYEQFGTYIGTGARNISCILSQNSISKTFISSKYCYYAGQLHLRSDSPHHPLANLFLLMFSSPAGRTSVCSPVLQCLNKHVTQCSFHLQNNQNFQSKNYKIISTFNEKQVYRSASHQLLCNLTSIEKDQTC